MNERNRKTSEAEPAMFNRLPKWAQARLNQVENENARLRVKLSEGPEESEATLAPYSDTPVPLGKKPHIMFGTFETGYFDVTYENGRLTIRGGGTSIEDTFVVLPSAANAVTIAVLADEGR